jgi:hypothetical protein
MIIGCSRRVNAVVSLWELALFCMHVQLVEFVGWRALEGLGQS